MTKPQHYFFALILLVCSACSSSNKKPDDSDKASLIGRWHRFTMANGYTEFDIDAQFVNFYNQKVGRFKLPYKIEKDSIKYVTHKYAAKITYFGDSIYLEGNDSTTATLYRFKGQDVPFTHIPEAKDSVLFASYLKGFDTRLITELKKAGISFSEDLKTPDDASYQELLKKKNL